jgi:hypothetical protein
MRGFFNPENGFFPFLHTVAYCLDVEPKLLGGAEETAAIREVFDRNGKPGEAEAAVRTILERKKTI